jgi:hypothetical protein
MTDSAQWMAPRGVEQEKNVHFRARAGFDLLEVPAICEIKIAAESRYRLCCNGREVASGPTRSSKALVFFDTHDLAPFLKAGCNELEILVGCANIPTFKYAALRPALWAELDGKVLEWQVARDESFAADAPLYNWHTGFSEQRDLRVENFDWQAPEFFVLEKELMPRDCALLETTTHRAPGSEFPLSLEKSEVIVFDFAREIIGGAQLEIEAEAGTKIQIGYGERLENGHLPVFDAESLLGFADGFSTRAGKQILEPALQERGFRFLQISADAPIVIHDAIAVDRRQPVPAPNFHCEDERFNRLYRMAHHTVSSCTTDVITDCPWREMALWMNDLIVNALFWMEIGGDPQVVVRCLRLSLSERNADGLIHGVVPNAGREEIVFLATNAVLPLILRDVSERDEKLAFSFLPQAAEVLESLQKFCDTDGLLIGPEKYWNFLDWSFEKAGWVPNGRAMASINWFYVLALDAMAELSRRAGQEYSQYQQRAEQVAAALHARFWDEKNQRYREFEDEDKASELAQALAILTGRDINAGVLCAHLAADGDELFKPELYMMHFVLRALIENGLHEAAKARLLRYWGAILESGSPTIWEANVHQHGGAAFNGAASLCHAFSCAPLWALPEIFKVCQEREKSDES